MAIPTPKAGATHQLILRYGAPGSEADIGLMLPNGDLRLYATQPYVPFAPAARQGEATNRDFSVASVWELHNDFSGGVGHLSEQVVESGDYAFAQGADDADVPALGATLFTAKRKVILPAVKETDAGAVGTFKQFIEFNGGLYAVTNATPGVIYKFAADGNSASVVETLSAACTQLFTDGTTLYASQGASNKCRTTTDGATWADAAYNSNVHAVRDEGVLTYAYGSTLVPGTGYADTVQIGWTSTTINSMVYFNNALWIGKPEGLYVFQYGRVSCVFPVYDQFNASNFAHMVVHHGLLYFNVQNHLFYTNGQGKFVNLFPDDTNGFVEINCLFATFAPLLIACKMRLNQAGDTRSYLLQFDGPEHPGTNPLWSDADGAKTIVGCGATNVFDQSKVRIYLSQTSVGERWLDVKTTYEPASYRTSSAAKAFLDLTEFSAGFRAIPKWTYQVVLNVRNPQATTFAQVWYSVDNGAWTQTVNENGAAQTLTLSARAVGTYLAQNTVGTFIQFRVYLWTTNANTVAEISHFTVRGLVRVRPRNQISFPVDCSKTVAPLQGDAMSGETILAAIRAAAAQAYPCKLQDPEGNWHLVVFREPTPTVAIRAYETPSGNAPERMFSIVQCVLMELDPLGAEGARLAWSAG